jgi:alpha-L-arabinofuranosidase
VLLETVLTEIQKQTGCNMVYAKIEPASSHAVDLDVHDADLTSVLAACLQDGKPVTGQDSCWASAVVDQATHTLIIKLVNGSAAVKTPTVNLADGKAGGPMTITTLANPDRGTMNSLDQPTTIAPVPVTGKTITRTVPGYSLTVWRIPVR